jgi:hypothetical protein
MNSYEGDRGDDSQHGGQHDDDEPRGAIRGLWGGLSDPHGVDESVRYEEKELHLLLRRGLLR